MKTKLLYKLIFASDAAVFEGEVNGYLDRGWDLSGELAVVNVTTKTINPDIELTTLFQAMTKVVPEVDEKKAEEANVSTAKKG
jgi:hypothetical protein